MSKKRILTIDNGGSELRMIRDEDISQVVTIDKNISIIEDTTWRIKDGVDGYDVINIIEAPKAEYKNMYAMNTAFYMYEGVQVTMTNQERKTNSPAWYQQVIIAIALDAIRAARGEGKVPVLDDGEVAPEPFDGVYDYILTTLIPVREHLGAVDSATKLKESLEGTYTAVFPAFTDGIKTVRFTLSKDNIGVLPEGIVAISAIKDKLGKMDHTLIIDMGHVTTDLAMCKYVKPIGHSVVSSQFAGSTLLNLVGGVIRNHNVSYSDELAVDALTTYKFKVGKNEINVSTHIDQAKDIFVKNYIKKEILAFIERSGISTATVTNVVPLGAVLGMKNPNTQKNDILEMIIEECNLSHATICTFETDLRHVNVTKAAEFARVFGRSRV